MSDNDNTENFKPEVDQQGGGPGSHTGDTGGENSDVASGGGTDAGQGTGERQDDEQHRHAN